MFASRAISAYSIDWENECHHICRTVCARTPTTNTRTHTHKHIWIDRFCWFVSAFDMSSILTVKSFDLLPGRVRNIQNEIEIQIILSSSSASSSLSSKENLFCHFLSLNLLNVGLFRRIFSIAGWCYREIAFVRSSFKLLERDDFVYVWCRWCVHLIGPSITLQKWEKSHFFPYSLVYTQGESTNISAWHIWMSSIIVITSTRIELEEWLP